MPMNILSIDIGGTHVKIRVPNDPEKRSFDSGPTLTPRMMVDGVSVGPLSNERFSGSFGTRILTCVPPISMERMFMGIA